MAGGELPVYKWRREGGPEPSCLKDIKVTTLEEGQQVSAFTHS